MKFYKDGIDQETRPCIELDEGSVHTDLEVIFALIKALIKAGAITREKIVDEL